MRRTITEDELREECDAILDAVERGDTFIITRGGRPLAELLPLRGRNAANKPAPQP